MTDLFDSYASSIDAPAKHADAITPDDDNDLGVSTRAIYVGVTGNVKVTTVGGDTVTFSAVPVGLLPVRVQRVWSTGTTATSLIGLW